jgi:hypothetical protein
VSDKPTRIAAFDPGKTTGWAVRLDDATPQGQCPASEVGRIVDLACGYGVEVIVVEYDLQRAVTFDPIACEVAGRIFEAARRDEIEVVTQTPSEAKFFFTDERLKERGLYTPGKPHQNDAWRHILRYLADYVPEGGNRDEKIQRIRTRRLASGPITSDR